MSTLAENQWMLAVDTSTNSMSVALTRGDALVGEITSAAERNHSLYLVPTIQRLLKEAGVRPKELSAFAVGVGPGSYTGVRIGVTVAKTFAWTHKLALIGVSTMEALALGGAVKAWGGGAPEADGLVEGIVLHGKGSLAADERARWVVPMLDARRGQVFTGLYEVRGSKWKCLIPDGIRLMSAWVDELLSLLKEQGAASFTGVAFTGELELHLEEIRRFAGDCDTAVLEAPHKLLARHIAELGLDRWREGLVHEVHTLVPNYTQLPEAEAKLLAKKS
jgi:tRNA threonylcarbamoyladenosine biosynthesis protein TsaB